MPSHTLTDAEIITLKYWTPGPFAEAYCGNSAKRRIAAGYGGLDGCLDDEYLSHGYPADVYRPTQKGLELLNVLRDQRNARLGVNR